MVGPRVVPLNEGGNRRGRRTRAALVEAARRVFARKGHEATSVADIVAEAGLSRTGFYRHFRNKQEVLVAVLGELFTDLLAAFQAGAGLQGAASTEARTRAIVAACARHADEVRLYLGASMTDPGIRELRWRARDAVVASTAQRLVQASGGILTAEEARVVAIAMEGMVTMLLEEWFLRGQRFDAQVVADVLSRLMWAVEGTVTRAAGEGGEAPPSVVESRVRRRGAGARGLETRR